MCSSRGEPPETFMFFFLLCGVSHVQGEMGIMQEFVQDVIVSQFDSFFLEDP